MEKIKYEKWRRWPWRLPIGMSIVFSFCLVAAFADFLAPYPYYEQSLKEPFAPPATLRWRNPPGKWSIRPFIYPERLVDSLGRRYATDTRESYQLDFFSHGYSYRFLGLFPTSRHLFGLQSPEGGGVRVYLLGTDAYGRDRLSRLLIAAEFSLRVGIKATFLASLLGILIGSLAGFARHWFTGYAGRWLDAMLMRIADVTLALPTLVLILAMRATYPPELSAEQASRLMIIIFVALGWAEIARLTYGLVLELRERDFVYAAISLGSSPVRVLIYHILPNAAWPLITQVLLLMPAILLAETSLSFLGVGLQEPEPSWGNMLSAAADLSLLRRSDAWAQISPAFAIMLFVFGIRLLTAELKKK